MIPDVIGLDNPSIIERKVVFQTPYQKVYKLQAEFDDFTKQYFVVEDNYPRAGVVIEEKGKILLVRQYRLINDHISLELPGGGVGQSESPQETASRECYEETGGRGLELKPLLTFHLGLDTVYCPNHLFFTDKISDEVKKVEPNAKGILESIWVPLNDCIQLIFSGEILDGFTVTGLMTYKIQCNNH